MHTVPPDRTDLHAMARRVLAALDNVQHQLVAVRMSAEQMIDLLRDDHHEERCSDAQ